MVLIMHVIRVKVKLIWLFKDRRKMFFDNKIISLKKYFSPQNYEWKWIDIQ